MRKPQAWSATMAANDTLAQSSTYRNLVVLEEVRVVHRIVTSDDHARYELTEEITPLEAGLGWVVKFKKGDYVGRDVLVAQKENGLERRLCGFEVVERGIAREGHEILADGEVVGTVTSGAWSPTFEKAIGMGYLPTAVAEPETPIEIQVRKRRLEARVVELPFYRRPQAESS